VQGRNGGSNPPEDIWINGSTVRSLLFRFFFFSWWRRSHSSGRYRFFCAFGSCGVSQLALAHFGRRQKRRWAEAISSFTRSRAHRPNSLGQSQKESKKRVLVEQCSSLPQNISSQCAEENWWFESARRHARFFFLAGLGGHSPAQLPNLCQFRHQF
jgi:hypothetical protein